VASATSELLDVTLSGGLLVALLCEGGVCGDEAAVDAVLVGDGAALPGDDWRRDPSLPSEPALLHAVTVRRSAIAVSEPAPARRHRRRLRNGDDEPRIGPITSVIPRFYRVSGPRVGSE
jgi:hypothetical protein